MLPSGQCHYPRVVRQLGGHARGTWVAPSCAPGLRAPSLQANSTTTAGCDVINGSARSGRRIIGCGTHHSLHTTVSMGTFSTGSEIRAMLHELDEDEHEG
eukprot:5885111-Prymnesium_polylepis.1